MPFDFPRLLFMVFLVMDPIGVIPQFLSVTSRCSAETRKKIILKAVLIAGSVLLVFLLAGRLLLKFFGIMPGAFYISGGILFFFIAFGMIYSRPGLSHYMPAEKDGGEQNDPEDKAGLSIALFPLAIPFIAGPGLLTVIIMFVSSDGNWIHSVAVLLPVIAINLAIVYVTLRSSAVLLKLFGALGISVIEKIMGLILSGFAVQFIYNGLLALGIIHQTIP